MSYKRNNTILFTIKLISLICLLGVTAFLIICRTVGSTENALPSVDVTLPSPTIEPSAVPSAEIPVSEPDYTIEITEIMPSNKSFITDGDGDFSDWIELLNSGSSEIDLSGCSVSDKAGSSGWVFPSVSLKSGERIVVFCSGKDSASAELHTDFSLSSHGETVTLLSPSGKVIQSVEYPACGDDMAYIPGEEAHALTYLATPGYVNSDYEKYISENDSHGDLVIYEAAPYNSTYEWQNGEFYDWIELKNVSDSALALSDYYLNDDLDAITEYALPDKTLYPGETFIVFCSGNTALTTDGREHAPFAISSSGESLYLYKKDGTLSDSVYVHDIPVGGSCGRIDGKAGFFIFTEFSPKSASSAGFREAAAAPAALTEQGVYEGVNSISVELSGEGKIYYTTDGSVPTTGSTEYKSPISLSKTTVIRAISAEPGKLNSPCASFSYILNEGHELPVVSVTLEQSDFDTMYSRYDLDLEEASHVSFFDGDNSFDLDCGIKLHGETSKAAQDKKSFKLCFRSRYDGALDYDLFENGVTSFSSILLRAAQEDYYSTQMRDNLMHQLAIQCDPELSSQDYKYAVLYVNGKYWGLYNIREAHSTDHFANHRGYDPDKVVQYKESWPYFTDMAETYDFMRTHDLSNNDNYNHVCSHLDINSLINWTIIQAYSGNIDCEPTNVRYYYTEEDHTTHIALVDLDLGMFSYETFDVPFDSGYVYSELPTMLLSNTTFRKEYMTRLSEYLNGPLSVDNAISLIDQFEAEIESEIPRDKERWGGSLETWKSMVNDLRIYLKSYGGRPYCMANAVNKYFGLSTNDWNYYFGSIPYYQ